MNRLKNDPIYLTFDIDNARISVTVSGGFFNLEKLPITTSSAHSHSVYEIHAVMSGAATVKTDLESFTLGVGECILLPPEVQHSGIRSDTPCLKSSFCFSFSELHGAKGSLYSRLCDSLGGLRTGRRIYDSKALFPALNRAFGELYAGGVFGEEKIKLILSLIILELAEECTEGGKGRREHSQKRELESDSLIYAVMEEYVTRSFNNGASLRELASHVHMSERNAARIFKRHFGTSFSEHVRRRRADTAKYLLLHTEMSLSDITTELGFSTYAGFFKFFTSVFGRTPSELRESSRENKKENQK